jgi:phosphoserine aminotransferase
MLSYGTHVKENSLYNTPPTFGIYIMSLVLQWIADRGGLVGIGKENRVKADLLYAAIDSSAGYYNGTVEKESRSIMNVCFRMKSEELEEKFIKESKAAGMIGLKGHRSVGGIRASIYNAVPLDAIKALVAFMSDFKAKNG